MQRKASAVWQGGLQDAAIGGNRSFANSIFVQHAI